MIEAISTRIPHAEIGAEACPRCLTGKYTGAFAEVVCSECGEQIAYIPSAGLIEFLHDLCQRKIESS